MKINAWWSLIRARQRREKGLYDHETLHLFSKAIRARGRWKSPWQVVAYVQFLRDLGYLPPKFLISQLMDNYPYLLGAKLRQSVLRLAAEVMPCRLSEVAGRSAEIKASPPALARHFDAYKGSPLILIDAMQVQWRADFEEWLLLHCTGAGICVVGNAAILAETKLGRHIDGHGAVVRFNRFACARDIIPDVGEQLDVWVLSPGYRGPVPVSVKWVVMAGPDVRYTLRNWSLLLPMVQKGTRVLTVPLSVWKTLVRHLKAPPSAGILLLQWLREMLGTWHGISVAGVGEWSGMGSYHLAVRNHQPGSRHQWAAERALVTRWCEEGLVRLRASEVADSRGKL